MAGGPQQESPQHVSPAQPLAEYPQLLPPQLVAKSAQTKLKQLLLQHSRSWAQELPLTRTPGAQPQMPSVQTASEHWAPLPLWATEEHTNPRLPDVLLDSWNDDDDAGKGVVANDPPRDTAAAQELIEPLIHERQAEDHDEKRGDDQ